MKMKKNIVFFILAVSFTGIGAWGQDIDTLRGRNPHYMYQWWDDSAGVCYHDGYECRRTFYPSYYIVGPDYSSFYDSQSGGFMTEVAAGFFVDSGVTILGIAVVSDTIQHLWWGFPVIDTSRMAWTAEVSLYNPYPGGILEPVRTATIHADSVSRRMILGGFPRHLLYGFSYFEEWVHDVREIIFENPVIATDSFYIGCTIPSMSVDPIQGTSAATYSLFPTWQEEYHIPNIIDPHRYPQQKYFAHYGNESAWRQKNSSLLLMVYPIIELPGDSCPEVRDLLVAPQGGGNVLVRWSEGVNHTRWEVAYGPVGTAPEDCNVVTATGNVQRLTGLDPDSQYVVYVRALCRLGDLRRSDWTATSAFYPTIGTLPIAEGGDGLLLAPNPAAGRMTVTLPQGVRSLTVHSVDGREVYRRDTPPETFDIDVSRWARGVYTVGVESDRGSTTRKLVVEADK